MTDRGTDSHVQMPRTLGEAIRVISTRLSEAGIDSSRLDARLLVAHGAGISSEEILLRPERALSEMDRQRIGELVTRRANREPLSQILCEREFWSMRFEVTPATLTPRPETECLVDAVLSKCRSKEREGTISILDLGTGSGCILLALLSEIPRAKGVGVDRSAMALTVAERNAKFHGLEKRVSFQKGCWFCGIDERFDIIVSNPPYIESDSIAELEPEVALYEPDAALNGGVDGLESYRLICSDLKAHLRQGGIVAFEIGSRQSSAVSTLMKGAGLSEVQVMTDLSGLDRVVLGRHSI